MNDVWKELLYPILTKTVRSGWNLLCPLHRTRFLHKSSEISCDSSFFFLGKPPPKGSVKGEGGRSPVSGEKPRKQLKESSFQKPGLVLVVTQQFDRATWQHKSKRWCPFSLSKNLISGKASQGDHSIRENG